MVMDTKTLEKKGISAVTNYLCDTGFIDPHLNCDDTIPMWDGNLFVYKTKEKFSNDNFDYYVPVQVKSHKIDGNSFPEHTSFSIPIVDLKNYHKDGGLAFFKVLINDLKETSIYCAFLNKAIIEKLLEEKVSQLTKTITLNKAPKDYRILLENLKRINMLRHHEQIDLSLLSKHPNFKLNFTIEHVPSDTSYLEYIATHSVDLLVNLGDIPGDFYAKGGPLKLQLSQIENCNIKVGDKLFYNSYKRSFLEDGIHIFIGDSANMVMLYSKEYNNNNISFNYKLEAKTIEKVILDLEFILYLHKYKQIEIGALHINLPNFCLNDETVDAWAKSLNFWKDVKSLFEIIHVPLNLNPKTISAADEKQLRTLIQAFIYKEPVYCDAGKDVMHLFHIAGMSIYVFAKHIQGREFQLFEIYDRLSAIYNDDNNSQYAAPILSAILEMKELPANLYLINIVNTYKSYEQYNPMIALRANQDLLNLLNHYDNCQDKALLKAAVEIATWLKNDKKCVIKDKNLLLLNYLQTIYRQNGGLNEDEKEKLYKLKSSDNMTNFARYILLGNKVKAETHLDKMTIEQLNYLKTLPIYKFINIS